MERVAAGKITRAFGKEGEVIALLYDRFPRQFDTGEPLYVFIDALAVPLFISRFERRGKSGALVVFEDIDTEERAALIIGQQFHIRADRANDITRDGGPEEFIGYTAVLSEEDSPHPPATGIISSVEGNANNPLFNIRTDLREILVPASENFITAVEPTKQIIYLQVPSGLLEL